jgi:hypothetical protein
MKYLTKENVVLVMVLFLALMQGKDMWDGHKAPQRSREDIMERMRGGDRGEWRSRIRQREESQEDSDSPEGKAKKVSEQNKSCCDSKKS